MAVVISASESGLDPHAKNPESSAHGLFQTIASHNCGRKTKEQIKCGIKLLKENGHQPWDASVHIYRNNGTDAGWLNLYIATSIELSKQKLASIF